MRFDNLSLKYLYKKNITTSSDIVSSLSKHETELYLRASMASGGLFANNKLFFCTENI